MHHRVAVVGHLRTGLEPTSGCTPVPVLLGHVPALLLAVIVGWFGHINALSHMTKFTKFEDSRDTVVHVQQGLFADVAHVTDSDQ